MTRRPHLEEEVAVPMSIPEWTLRSTRSRVLLLALAACLTLGGTPSAAQRDTASAPSGEKESDERPDLGDYTWTVLEDRLTMRAPFNDMKGKLRVIAFFSPTCPRCLKNAGEIQTKFLERNDSQDIRMMIVWVKSLSTDAEEKLPLAIDIIPDPRVSHYWDPERVLNAQLIDAIAFPVNMNVYDVFLLYDREATWEKRLPRPGHFFHEVKRMPGPWWNLPAFVNEINRGLAGKRFTSPW